MRLNDRTDWRTQRRTMGWDNQPDTHDRLWGVVALVLGICGMAILILGQSAIYTTALWIGGLR